MLKKNELKTLTGSCTLLNVLSRRYTLLLGMLLFCHALCGQSVIVTGTVTDSLTHEPLSQVTIYGQSGSSLAMTGLGGQFSVTLKNKVQLSFIYLGYKIKSITIAPHQDTTVAVSLAHISEQLDDVVVSSGKRHKYTNKNNPAVELIRQVIAHKPENTIGAYTTAQYEKYAKLSFFVDRFPKWISKQKLLKNYAFVLKDKDTLTLPGKDLLPVYLEETVSQNHYRKKPSASSSKVIAEKSVDFGKFVDTRGLSALFNRLFEDINIYDNNIVVFTKQFVSPIAEAGPVWYKYYIEDTVTEEGLKFIRLHFVPRNNADLLFNGEMYISMDGRYAVKGIQFRTDDNINLGVVRSFSVTQDFTMDMAGHYYLNFSDVMSDFGLYKKTTGLIGRRTVNISRFESGMPLEDSVFKQNDDILLRNPRPQPDSFWSIHRTVPLQNGEQQIYGKMDSLSHMKSFQHATDWFNTFTSGYKTFGKWQVGPINSFIDYNPVEGFKPRVGGRTTPELNKNIYLNGYAAYGFRDHLVKYMGRVTYALNHKSIYSYPVHSIAVSKTFDTNIPGTPDDNEQGNILFANNNATFNRYFYNHIFRVDYLKEFDNHWAISAGLKTKTQHTGGDLYFIRADAYAMAADSIVNNLKTTELSLQVRWAPHEQFYQNGARRSRIPNKYPVFTFRYTRGLDGLLRGGYDYNYFTLNVQKRIFMSILGVSKVTLDGGYLTGQVPWPLLVIHTGNQGLGYSTSRFNIMNYMEFMSDHYASLSVEHLFNGLFFNRIPLVKKLKWREIGGLKILYGGVRKENNPTYNQNILKLPYAADGPTYFLSGKPYVELSAGVSNIFKILRVDFLKRMTYLDHPGIDKWSIKASINIEL